MLKNYLITSLTSCENLKLIKARVFNPDLAQLFIPLCVRPRPYREFIVFNRLRVSPHGVGGRTAELSKNDGATSRAIVTGERGRQPVQIPGGYERRTYGGWYRAAMTRQ